MKIDIFSLQDELRLFESEEEECDYVGFQLYKLRKSLNYDITDFYVEDEIKSFEIMLQEESEK